MTDLSGEVSQHVEYFPYGGIMTEARTSSTENPYLFNGKELDLETGLYYYGARYMEPDGSMWYGVDPLAEKYPGISPYCYTLGNPIKYVDVNGEEPGDFFKTKDEVAIDFSFIYNEKSIAINMEFGASIYATKDAKGNKRFTYTEPTKRTLDGVTPSFPPKGNDIEGVIHSHAAYDPNYDNNEFSPEDKEVSISIQETIYVSTPSGTLKKFTPKDGKTETILNFLPSDKNDPESPLHRYSSHQNDNTRVELFQLELDFLKVEKQNNNDE